ncbi:MAG TPA: DMT family transporter [Opitutus sp.]|nr:DMT family transporter [Opitutus sp.]
MPIASKSPLHVHAALMLVLATLCWGVSFPVMKALGAVQLALTPGAGSWFVAASVMTMRFGLAAALFGVFGFGALRAATRGEVRQGLHMGLYTGGGMILQIDGLQHTTASVSAFLTSFYAVLVPLWIAWRSRELPPRRVWASGLLVLAGVAVLARLDWRGLRLGRGEIETLLSSVFFTGQILTLARGEFARNRTFPVTFVMFVVQSLLGVGLGVLTVPAGGAVCGALGSGAWWSLILVLTTVCTLAAFTLMNGWQPKISPTEAGLIYSSEPVFASAMALFLPAWLSAWGGFDYPNERVTGNLIIGGGLITLANVLIHLNPSRRAARAGRTSSAAK